MAKWRPPKKCFHCGKNLKPIYLSEKAKKKGTTLIGDTFQGYKKCDCKN